MHALIGRCVWVRPLEPVPQERPDPHVVVVEPHLTIGEDVEPDVLLVADHHARCVVERLAVRRELECLEQILAGELVGEPPRPRKRSDHRRR
jgi:hypothetical protein